ncbi:hypothetical protein NDU88_012177 [Pleurodeles waltl]|uniref:Uncharacterized protein n=1 Tax=Pleurodeles waltl TaxID=8319 RepID=A0AAV7R3W4_PLEWA|nr:hypothetical protein NDU88_012177 [Pleurodeles waltl]
MCNLLWVMKVEGEDQVATLQISQTETADHSAQEAAIPRVEWAEIPPGTSRPRAWNISGSLEPAGPLQPLPGPLSKQMEALLTLRRQLENASRAPPSGASLPCPPSAITF